jgi:predicted ATPase with chaperone activity
MREATDAMRLSARRYPPCYAARTLADLDGAEKVGRVHLAEAMSYACSPTKSGTQRTLTRCYAR